MGAETFHALKKVLKEKGLSTAVGDEGGFAPKLDSATAALNAIALAVKNAGYKFGPDIAIALDPAASEFYDKEKKRYIFKKSDGRVLTGDQMVAVYKELVKKYPIISIEDGCAENDWETWKKLTDAIGDKVQLVGDDLFVTNTEFLKRGIDSGTANSILIKVNQIGSLTETLDAVEMAHEYRLHGRSSRVRSGETEDVTIADIAVATNAGQIKTGSLCRTDRVAKYNQLLRIEEELGASAIYGPETVIGFFHPQGRATHPAFFIPALRGTKLPSTIPQSLKALAPMGQLEHLFAQNRAWADAIRARDPEFFTEALSCGSNRPSICGSGAPIAGCPQTKS